MESYVVSVVDKACLEIGRSVFGQEAACRMLCGAFLIGGHILLEGPPGIAKTLLAKTFSRTLGLRFKRLQFTPDLMPSDVTGVYVFDQQSGKFRFAPGPVFADILLADEINRTPPKTQSALLEAMEEHFVTIDGKRHGLGDLFFVIATQNPIEHEGTFPLPEAQLDRFLFKLNMTYPGEEFEQQVVDRYSSELPSYDAEEKGEADAGVVAAEELQQARLEIRRVALDETVGRYIQQLVHATRQHSDVLLGASPRAALHLALAAKFTAALDGRSYVIPDDVKSVLGVTLSHRLVFQPDLYGEEGRARSLMDEIASKVPAPNRAVA